MDNVNFQAAQKKLQDSIIKEGVETGNITMIKVVGSSGGIVSFKINKHTPMSRVLDAYAKETGQERHTIRFRWAGVWISNTDTPGTLNMKDNDIINAINQYVEKPSQCESSPNSTTTPSMDSPRSRNHSPSSLNLKREEEKEKRAAEEQKEAEGRARKLAEEKARTVTNQAQREKEEKARKPAVEEAQREVKKSERRMLEERKRVEEQLLEEEETEKQQDDERKKNEAQDMDRGRQASSIWGTLYIKATEEDQSPTRAEIVGVKRKRSESSVNSTVKDMKLDNELANKDNITNTEQRLTVIESKMGRVVDQQQEILNLLSNTYKKLKKVRSHGGNLSGSSGGEETDN
ncbi:hypothetical protein F5879DRAFT_973732 [Lentinula edodes]|nr:hypothetical protein F5879DRAFT_973732 [Lentinula edodes]